MPPPVASPSRDSPGGGTDPSTLRWYPLVAIFRLATATDFFWKRRRVATWGRSKSPALAPRIRDLEPTKPERRKCRGSRSENDGFCYLESAGGRLGNAVLPSPEKAAGSGRDGRLSGRRCGALQASGQSQRNSIDIPHQEAYRCPTPRRDIEAPARRRHLARWRRLTPRQKGVQSLEARAYVTARPARLDSSTPA